MEPSQAAAIDLVEAAYDHLAAGHRLRRGLGEQGDVAGRPLTEMPLRAEARVVDKARGSLRRSDPEEALRLMHELAVKTQAQLVEKMRGLPDPDALGAHSLSQEKEE